MGVLKLDVKNGLIPLIPAGGVCMTEQGKEKRVSEDVLRFGLLKTSAGVYCISYIIDESKINGKYESISFTANCSTYTQGWVHGQYSYTFIPKLTESIDMTVNFTDGTSETIKYSISAENIYKVKAGNFRLNIEHTTSGGLLIYAGFVSAGVDISGSNDLFDALLPAMQWTAEITSSAETNSGHESMTSTVSGSLSGCGLYSKAGESLIMNDELSMYAQLESLNNISFWLVDPYVEGYLKHEFLMYGNTSCALNISYYAEVYSGSGYPQITVQSYNIAVN